MNVPDRNGQAFPGKTGVVGDLDRTLRGSRRPERAPETRLFLEGLREVAEAYPLCVVITPWTGAEMRAALHELAEVTFDRLTLGAQLGAELWRPGADTPELAPGLRDRRDAVHEFMARHETVIARALAKGLRTRQRGAIHTLEWPAEGEAARVGPELTRQAGREDLGTVVAPGYAHIMPAPFSREGLVERLVRQAEVETVLTATDAVPGLAVQRRLRALRDDEGSPLVRVICVGVGDDLAAEDEVLFDKRAAGLRELGELLLRFARYCTV